MTTSELAFFGLVALVGLERLVELALSLRNRRWALARGGIESGRRHYPWMVVLHTSLLAGSVAEVLLLERPFLPWLAAPMAILVAATMALRYWCIHTLGRRWNTRVIVVPGLPPVTGGPYRHLRHPNYLAVVVEGIALPLVHTAWLTALVFTLLDAAMLAIRIRCEEAALAAGGGYAEALGDRNRLVPRAR